MRTIHGLFLACASMMMLSACVSVKDELFLRNIEVDGSPSQPPVHITRADAKRGDVTVSPQLSDQEIRRPAGMRVPQWQPLPYSAFPLLPCAAAQTMIDLIEFPPSIRYTFQQL